MNPVIVIYMNMKILTRKYVMSVFKITGIITPVSCRYRRGAIRVHAQGR